MCGEVGEATGLMGKSLVLGRSLARARADCFEFGSKTTMGVGELGNTAIVGSKERGDVPSVAHPLVQAVAFTCSAKPADMRIKVVGALGAIRIRHQ